MSGLALVSPAQNVEEQPPTHRVTRIVGIGNSYTRELFRDLESMGRQHAPGAEVVLHQNWAWRADAFPDDPRSWTGTHVPRIDALPETERQFLSSIAHQVVTLGRRPAIEDMP